ncbi:MAG TPA: hypothetical protein VGN07_09845 [Steroidobacteraceae bacterium]
MSDLGITCTIEQGDDIVFSQLLQFGKRGDCRQALCDSVLRTRKALGTVIEPHAQLIPRRDLFIHDANAAFSFLMPRGKSLSASTHAIVGVGRVVDLFDSKTHDRSTGPFLRTHHSVLTAPPDKCNAISLDRDSTTL